MKEVCAHSYNYIPTGGTIYRECHLCDRVWWLYDNLNDSTIGQHAKMWIIVRDELLGDKLR